MTNDSNRRGGSWQSLLAPIGELFAALVIITVLCTSIFFVLAPPPPREPVSEAIRETAANQSAEQVPVDAELRSALNESMKKAQQSAEARQSGRPPASRVGSTDSPPETLRAPASPFRRFEPSMAIPDGFSQVDDTTPLGIYDRVQFWQHDNWQAAYVLGLIDNDRIEVEIAERVEPVIVPRSDLIIEQQRIAMPADERLQTRVAQVDELLTKFGHQRAWDQKFAATLARFPILQPARQRVFASLLKQTHAASEPEFRDALMKWIDVDDGEVLLDELLRPQSSVDSNRQTLLFELLAKINRADEVLVLLNNVNDRVRNSLLILLQSGKLPADAAVRQCLADLGSDKHSVRMQATAYLREERIPAELRGEVVDIALGRLPEDRFMMGVIENSGIEKRHIKPLIEVTSGKAPYRITLCEILGKSGEPEAIDFLIQSLDSAHHAGPVNALVSIGPSIEESLWPMLREAGFQGRFNACRVLEQVGTRKSLPHLRPLLKQRDVKPRVERAIEAITNR
ncbi:HEAT repeat domain-containing protein [Roseiconus lacunae]|uniref:HEAT repeat domain-containing protein n=1 Tax=Roseiconus lacunae TaxID=2605694 RepID=A0ABT7PP02_9BACT|nr:HEAT repeat domain-containing protein [Roseiconus lacunae]MDM4018237.1 HEAT repeat domain-containing protein [Roseiconus lacunae]